MTDVRGRSFLITGGFSLVGSHIAEHLLAAGAARVLLLDNASVGSPASVEALAADPRVTLVQADILRLDALMDAMQGVDGVFHTAFFITIPLARNLWTGMDVNVRGTMNVLEACRWQKVRRIVFSSSIAAYGHPTDDVVDESAGFQPGGMKPVAALYGAAKVMAEQLCALYLERHGVEFACLRYSTVYGERQHQRGMHVMAMMAAYQSARRNEPPVLEGDGTDRHDYVYVGDVARANLLAMQSSLPGESYTIATGVSTPVADVIRLVLDASGSTLSPRFLRSASDDPNAYQSVPRFDRGKAERELGWRPEVTLQTGIARMVAWADAHKNRHSDNTTDKATG